MVALPKPDVILTHESDLDGLLAGALLQKLAKKLFGTDTITSPKSRQKMRGSSMT
jgi:hypothetical protein